MTDLVKGFVITLDDDMREDDAERISKAVEMIRGVQQIDPVPVDGLNDMIAENRIRHELGLKLFELVYPGSGFELVR